MTRFLLMVALVFAVAPAQAHTGAGAVFGLAAGISHPLHGIDHLLAMIAVGMLAALRGGRALWIVPLAFVGVMVLGGVLGVANVPLPFVELGIALSVVVLGALVAFDARFATPVVAAIVGFFALMHGHAHGTEMPGTALGMTYGLGFVAATAALHGLGIGIGLAGTKQAFRSAVRFGGAAMAVAGLVLLAA